MEIKHNRTVKTATVTYLESSEPREIAVTEGFIGYRVIGLRGDYSQMLQTRLEVYRAPETEDYKGLLWPIGASNAWQVICKETP